MKTKHKVGCRCCKKGTDPCYLKCGTVMVPLSDLVLRIEPKGSGSPFTLPLRIISSDSSVYSWVWYPNSDYKLFCENNKLKFRTLDPGGDADGPTEVMSKPFNAVYEDEDNRYVITGPEDWPDVGKGNCEKCGPMCFACGHDVILDPVGSYTDDNGTGVMSLFNTGLNLNVGRTPNGPTDIPVWSDPTLVQGSYPLHLASGKLEANGPIIPVGQFCPPVDGVVNYAWGFWCNGNGTVSVVMAADIRSSCDLEDPPTPGYRKQNRMQPITTKVFPLEKVKIVVPTCENGELVATVSGWEIFLGTVNGQEIFLAPPSTTVTIRAPFSVPRPGFCCLPCTIPYKDLVLTKGDEESTLVFDKTKYEWSDGTYTLKCFQGYMRLTGSGETWALDPATYECEPLHLKFTAGISVIYIDE